MDQEIEISINGPDGIIDCRLEPQHSDSGVLSYSATILYPNIINGYSRSEIYCHNMVEQGSVWVFDTYNQDIHPKIQKLEAELSDIITLAK